MEELQDVSFEVCQGELALLVGHLDPARLSAFWLEENSGSAGWSDAMAKCGFLFRVPCAWARGRPRPHSSLLTRRWRKGESNARPTVNRTDMRGRRRERWPRVESTSA